MEAAISTSTETSAGVLCSRVASRYRAMMPVWSESAALLILASMEPAIRMEIRKRRLFNKFVGGT
jgi:muramidase (phage lysozyme)